MIEELLKQDQNLGGSSTYHEIKAACGRLLVGSWSTDQATQDHILNNTVKNPWATLIITNEKLSTSEYTTTNVPAESATVSEVSDALTPSSLPPNTLSVPGYYPRQHPAQFLARTLPASLAFIRSHLASSPDSRVAILCKDGRDLSVGVATAALALYFNDSGEFSWELATSDAATPTKDLIKRRLHWVLSSCPGGNPARATLRRINEYLMSPNRPSLQIRGV